MSNLLNHENSFNKLKHIKANLIYGDLNFNKNPLVSIAIPTYKRPDLLKRALDSALAQEGVSNYEIIITDNEEESETGTENLIRSYNNPKILYYRNEKNIGMTGNWNRGIELSRGKWYTMLHDDDVLDNNFLKEMLFVLEKNPNISLLKATHDHLDQRESMEDKNKNESYSIKNETRKFLGSLTKKIRKFTVIDYIIGNPIGGPVGIMMEREKAVALGGFAERSFPAPDYVFFTRYCINYNTYFYNKKLCYYGILRNESMKDGIMIGAAEIHYQLINELINKKLLQKLFFKKYPLYYVLKSIDNTENFWRVNVKDEELKFLGEERSLNIFWYFSYFTFKQIWKLKGIIM